MAEAHFGAGNKIEKGAQKYVYRKQWSGKIFTCQAIAKC